MLPLFQSSKLKRNNFNEEKGAQGRIRKEQTQKYSNKLALSLSACPNELQKKLQEQPLTHEHFIIRNLGRMQEVPGSWGNASRVPSFKYNIYH